MSGCHSAGFQVLSLHSSDLKVREYKKRKLHRKTAHGCTLCKEKRVKCDQTKPVCARCQRNGRACTNPRQGLNPHNEPSLGKGTCFTSLSATTVVPFVAPSAINGTPSIHLLQHLERHWAEVLQLRRNHEVIALFTCNALVRETMLALSACHLRHVSGGVLSHRIAEHFQQSLAIHRFRKMLSTPPEKLGQSDLDALLYSATMLNMMAFTLSPTENVRDFDDPRASWVYNQDARQLGWLALQAGIRPLVLALSDYLDDALRFLGPIFLGDGNIWAFAKTNTGLEHIPATWVKCFELDMSNAVITRGCELEVTPFLKGDEPHEAIVNLISTSNLFLLPISVLAQLRVLRPVRTNVFKHLQFLGKIQPGFRTLLFERNERALWTYGYWLGLMCRFDDTWWCEQRVRRDYTAICRWLASYSLETRPGPEGEMWREMMKDLDRAPYQRPSTL